MINTIITNPLGLALLAAADLSSNTLILLSNAVILSFKSVSNIRNNNNNIQSYDHSSSSLMM